MREVPLFHQLPDEELFLLAGQAIERAYARGAVIFWEGDNGDGLYVVMSGRVAISRQNERGDELILAVAEPAEFFGELALFDQEPRSATATALEASSVIFLARLEFRAFLENHPSAMLACLDVIVQHLRRCTDLVDEIALLDIPSRLARRLVRLSEDAVSRREHEQPGDFVRVTQGQLASMTGATRESVNKHLKLFEDAGIIRLDRGKIEILDRPRLQDLAS